VALLDLLRPPSVTVLNPRREVAAGLTTFLTMAYILFVNPTIVGSGFELALMHAIGSSTLIPQYQELVYTIKLGVAAGTAIAAAFGTLLMAFFARLPFAMAPGMGENSFIAFSVIPVFTTTLLNTGVTGPRAAEIAMMVALTSVFIDGLIFLFTTWSGIRERIVRSISPNLAIGISVGIGLFITLIRLYLSGFVEPGTVPRFPSFGLGSTLHPSAPYAVGLSPPSLGHHWSVPVGLGLTPLLPRCLTSGGGLSNPTWCLLISFSPIFKLNSAKFL